MGSCSVVQCIRHLMGQPLYCSSADADMCVWGGGMTPPPTHDSALSHRFHGCPAFLRRHFPPQSRPSPPLHRSLCSQQQPLAWNCSTIPKLQFPASAPSRKPAIWSRVGMAVARTVWFSFHLDCHRSVVSLSALSISPLTQTIAPVWGSDPCFSSHTHQGQFQSY